MFRRRHPDVIVMDLSLRGGLAGLDLISRIRRADKRTPILVFSMHSDPVVVSRALKAGATGYVLKDAGPHDFLEAFQSVRARKPYLSHQMAVDVALLTTQSGGSSPLANVTTREFQVLSLLADGRSYAEIADEIGVSYKTVVNVCSQLKAKLGARNLPELIRAAVQHVSSRPTRAPLERHAT